MKKDKDGMPVKQDPISEKVKRLFEKKDIGFMAVMLPIIAAFVIMLVCFALCMLSIAAVLAINAVINLSLRSIYLRRRQT